MHGVGVYSGKNWCRGDNGRRYKDLCGLSGLAYVTSANEPKNVGMHMRPPESLRNVRSGCEKAFVSNIIVGCAHNLYSAVFVEDEFVCALGVFAPNSLTVFEEAHAISYELSILFVG